MIVGIHQPQYLPWLGIIDRVMQSDIFVMLDNVPYSKNYFYNRNRIKTANGWCWLTVPVLFKGRFGTWIKDIMINNRTNWREKHWKSILSAYNKAPFFKVYKQYFEEFLYKEWIYVSEVSIRSLILILRLYGIDKKIVKASELDVKGSKEELLVNICKELGADSYFSGPDGKDYINLDVWRANRIEVIFQNFKHPKYPQLYGDFISQMSAIDFLFNCGRERGQSILMDKEGEKIELMLK